MCDSSKGRSKMFCWLLLLIFSGSLSWTPAVGRVIQKRAAFYIANETMCIVDGDIYRNGDPVPTDDECERCTCRPPGFSCVLRDCETKPGCKAVRKIGECCPEYVCGCVHNSRLYEDGELIRDLQNNCYTCRCHGSSISCTFADCHFRGDCPPEYIPGECCPRYDHCPPASTTTTTTTTTTQATTPAIVQEEIEFFNMTTQHLEKFTSEGTTVTIQDILTGDSQFTTSTDITAQETLFTVKFTLSGEKISSVKDYDEEELTTILPRHTVGYKETTNHIVTPPGSELTSLKFGLVAGDFETTTPASSSSESETPFSVTAQPDIVFDTESTTQSTDSHSQDVEISTTTESGTPDDLTGISDSDSAFVTPTYEDKITTVKQAEDSTFDSDSRHYSTEKYDSSSDSLPPVFVPDEEDANETTTHEQDSHLQTEPEVSTSTEDNVSQDSDHTPVPSREKETTLLEYSEVSTSDKILAADSFDSESVLLHTDTTEGEITTEESEKHESTESTADIDLQTSDDVDLLHKTSHSTALDSSDLQTVSDHSELYKESTTDLSIDDGEISHAPTHIDAFEHTTDHQLKPTSTVGTEELVTEHDKSFTDDLETGTSTEHEHTSNSYSDIHTDIDSTDGYDSEHDTIITHETSSDFSPEVSESSLDPSETTGILDLQNTSDIGTLTVQIADISNTEEASNDTVGTEVHTDDHTYSEETGSTDTHVDKTTSDLHITFEELDTSDAVSQNEFSTDISTISDHHLSSGQGLTSTFPENQSTISDLSSVSLEEDLTTSAESVDKETTTDSSAVDTQSQSTEFLEVRYRGTTDGLESTDSTGVTSDNENTSVGEEISESESKYGVTEFVDSSQELEESVSNLPSSEHSESEESYTPSVSTDGEESDYHKETVTDEDTLMVTEETLKSATLISADSETRDSVTDREPSTVSIPTTDRDTEEDESHTGDDETEELETETSNDYHPTVETKSETHDQTTGSTEQSSEPGELVDLHTNLHESSDTQVTTGNQEISSPVESENSSEEEISNKEIESTKHSDEVTPLIDTTTSRDFPSQSTTKEIKSEQSHTDALQVKHDIPLHATQSPLLITSKPEHTSTTTESDIPSEIPAFEPPLANILKQSMLFRRPTAASKNTSVSLLPGDIENDKTNSSSNSSDENQFVRLSLTLAGEDKDSNATLIHEDSENKIFVLNHEYTISDAEVNIETDEHETKNSSEVSLSSVTEESEEHLETVSTEQGTSSEYPSTTKDYDINPNPFYSDKDESIPSISETEEQHSELSTETTETESLTHEHINNLNLLSETLGSETLSEDDVSHNANTVQNIDGNLSEEHSTINLHTTSFPENIDITENPTSGSEHENEKIVTYADLLVSTNAPTQSETTEKEDSETSHVNDEDQELLIRSPTSADNHESTTEKDTSDATADDEGVGSDAIEHTEDSSDDDKNDNFEDIDHTNEANSESNFDHSDLVTNDSVTSTIFTGEDKDKHNETDIDYSYHDAETAESSEEDKEVQTMSLSSLDPGMITALQEIGTSLIGNISEIDNSSFPVNTEYNYASTTQAEGSSDTPSTVQINVLFGQDSYSSNTETTETDIDVTKIKYDSSQDSNDENNFHYTGTEDSVLDEESSTFTHSEDLKETHPHADNTETVYTTLSQGENEGVREIDIYSHEILNITSDTSETPTVEENADRQTKPSTQFNADDLSDKMTSTHVSLTVDSHDAEEISSPFTILEYIGDLFSGVSTFSTASDDSNEGNTNEETTETSENSAKLTDSTTENENMTISPQEAYSSILKNQFAEYGSLGGVFITGQSKYNKSTSDETSQDHINEPDENLNASDVTEDGADLVHLNSNIQINPEVHTLSENVHSDSEESTQDNEFINTVEILQQSTTIDDAVADITEHVDQKSTIEPGVSSTEETLTTISDNKKEKGPEKGGEWFEPLDSDFSHDENEEGQNISADTEIDNAVTTGITTEHGPEKGGEVFEPSFPELFPLGSATSHTSIHAASENTHDEYTVTESVTEPSYSVTEETENDVSTQSNVINTTKVPSGLPDSDSETITDSHFKSQFVPPLPILLKDLGKSDKHNGSHSRDSEDEQNKEKSSSGGSEGDSSKNISKFEYARNIRHPFPLSDIISQVFKAPGYDSEVHLSPLTGSVPSKRSQLFRLKRDVKMVPREENINRKEESSTYATSSNDHASSSNDADPFKTKHILSVEGYGHKPAGFFPVTSTFIFVHSDEENETGDESKKKTAKGGDPQIEYLDEIPFESLEKEVSLSGVGKTHQTK